MSEATNEHNTSKVTWQAEQTHPELIEGFKSAMREVVDPELGLSIIELGLIRDVKIEDDNAEIMMILTTPFCPYGPAMIESTRQKAEQVLELPVGIDFGMDAWDFSMMEEGLGGEWGLF